MKKILEKDNFNRKIFECFEKQKFIIKSISKNSCFSNLIRFNALDNLKELPKKSSNTFYK
jgi:hypothetical protein